MALDLDGVNSASGTRIRTSPGVAIPTAHSFLCWLNIDAMTGITSFIYAQRTTQTFEWVLRDSGGEVQTMAYEATWSSGNGRWVAPASLWAFDTLAHFAVTYDAASTSNDPAFYFNGVSVTPTENLTPSGTLTTDTGDMLIGGRESGLTHDGFIGDFRVYDRVLSAAEILSIFTLNGKDDNVQGLIHRYKMDEAAPGVAASGSGSIKDTGSLADDGTQENGPLYAAMPISHGRLAS